MLPPRPTLPPGWFYEIHTQLYCGPGGQRVTHTQFVELKGTPPNPRPRPMYSHCASCGAPRDNARCSYCTTVAP